MKEKIILLILLISSLIFPASSLLTAQGLSEPTKVTAIGDVYVSRVLPGSWKYNLKIWRDRMIDLVLIFNPLKRSQFELKLANKRLLEAQELSELGSCDKIDPLTSQYQEWMARVFAYLKVSKEKEWETGRFVVNLYRSLPQQKQVLERIEFLCPDKERGGKDLKRLSDDFKKEAESYWGLDQLRQFQQEMIQR